MAQADNPIIRAWVRADKDKRLEALEFITDCYGENMKRIIQYFLNKKEGK